MGNVSLEQVVALALQLSPIDKVHLIMQLASTLENELSKSLTKQPLETFKGALAHLGPGPSDEDIDEVRRDMWKNFPREDI
jgi:hypothetical protein